MKSKSHGCIQKKSSTTAAEKSAVKKGSSFFSRITPEYLFAALATAFCAASLCALWTSNLTFTDINFVAKASLSAFIAVMLLVFAFLVLCTVCFSWKRLIPAGLFLLSLILCIQLVITNPSNMYFNIGVVLVMSLIAFWVTKEDKLGTAKWKITVRQSRILAVICFSVMALTIGIFTILRHEAYATANFDFGIFAQMFEYMKNTGLPNTTTERNYLLSHFGVHFSPIYYLLLPGYYLFSCPEYLLAMQALAVAAGIFAVYGICRRLDLDPKTTSAFLLLYTFFPTLTGGCFYDFHENKFLTVLILWCVYFMLSHRSWPLYLFCFLTLMVKEDAAIYVATMGLFMLVNQKDYKRGFIVLGMSVAYFIIAISVVGALGDGVMVGRLENYFLPGVSGTGGFFSVMRTCFSDIGYLISQVFTEAKLPFIFWMLTPVFFTPFFNKKISTVLLLIPMLVINLMPNYVYQYDVSYQYTFGVAALILAAAIFTIGQMPAEKRRFFLIASVSASLILTFSLNYTKINNVCKSYRANRTVCEETSACISRVPKDAQVTATTFLIPHMSDFKNLYMYPNYYAQSQYTEYLVVKSTDPGSENGLSDFMGEKYEKVDSGGMIEVYRLKSN